MQRLNYAYAVLDLVWICSTPVAAASQDVHTDEQTSAGPVQHTPREFEIRFGARGRFTRLFQPPTAPRVTPPPRERPRQPPKPRVSCGMLMIPADPSIDPGIAITGDRNTEFKIRAVEPSICWPK
jgi:hypothetical protein